MKIAYLILAFKNPDQVARLVTRLNNENTFFMVHYDKKSPLHEYRRLVDCLRHLSNVHFMERYKTYWAHFSNLYVQLRGIEEIIEKRIPFDYLTYTTGQDYPIKPSQEILDFLEKNDKKLFLRCYPISAIWGAGGWSRIERYHIRIPGIPRFLYRVPFLKRRLPKGYEFFGGSAYWWFTKECIQYIHNHIRENPSFLDFFKYGRSVVEIFFHTVVLNSPFKKSVVNDDLRYIVWPWKGSPHPVTFDKSHFEKIARSPKLFARKFDMRLYPEILDMIDKELLHL
ncbi:MAG: hypothetical protein A2Z72_03210 [Omnitrophica bacterium RBG_13_46_9]|nr:MAG: hypothetical protein A2Z72_03210 [Omnitrophica bacterium RBG_13_46_9]